MFSMRERTLTHRSAARCFFCRLADWRSG